MGNKLDKNQENITNLNNTIISDFVLIESGLFRLEHFINDSRNAINLKHTQYENKLAHKFTNIESLSNDLAQKNEYLKRKLNRTKRYSFLNQQIVFKFKECDKDFEDIMIEEYYFNLNRCFTMEKKIKYLHLFTDFEIIQTDQIPCNCYNFIIIPLNRNRIFYCCGMFEKKSFMKITNKFGVELHRELIDPTSYYREFMAFDEHIVGLFDDSNNETNMVEIYNQYLKKLSKRSFKTRLELWSVSQNQFILRTIDTYEYTVYNFNLELKFTLNLKRIIDETGLKNSIYLTALNNSQIYLFYSHLLSIKKIDKKTGTILGDIYFDNNLSIKSFHNVKMDSENNFLIKQNSTNKITYYSDDGKLLAENTSDLIKCFNLLDVTHQNDICYSDNLNRKIYCI